MVPFDAKRESLSERVGVMQATPVTMASGWWKGMLMQDREDAKKPMQSAILHAEVESKLKHREAMEWAERADFAPELCAFAACAALSLRERVGEGCVTKQMVLDRCRAQWPDIFGERVTEQAA